MIENIRGIECSLDSDKIEKVLLFLAEKPFSFYVRWCMYIDDECVLLPKSSQNFWISRQDLRDFAGKTIWELVMDIYPVGSNSQIIETYEDFANSSCICCLIFYDCGSMDIFIKESSLRDQLNHLLLMLQAEDLELITDVSNSRTLLYL